jgi:hypothetical protein
LAAPPPLVFAAPLALGGSSVARGAAASASSAPSTLAGRVVEALRGEAPMPGRPGLAHRLARADKPKETMKRRWV